MSPAIALPILGAALLHAGWNAVLRRPGDRLRTITAMSVVTASIAAPIALLLPLPANQSWSYLLISAALQVAYSVFLILAYAVADLGQAYPITRGAIPLFAALGAAVFAHQIPGMPAMAGIAAISLGAASLAVGKRRMSARALGLALGTSVVIACYNVVDGMGVRLAGNPYVYPVWVFLLYGLFMPLAFTVLKRHRAASVQASWPVGPSIVAGTIQFATYGIVLWAFSQASVASVVALRETSMVFAIVIGHVFLGEALTTRRIVAVTIIMAGAVALSRH